ncbi:MAG TPA: hypothetical protein VMA37_16415 [Acetobacteraceae bacterium]|nr:hypothetical protein [Acetobacteraceae bacterium]
MEDEIRKRISSALTRFRCEEIERGRMTTDSNVTEWHFAYHFANCLSQQFPCHTCDIEVSKPNLNNKRPDIIIHKRGTHDHNLLIVELKRDRSADEIRDDIIKIKRHMFAAPYCYQFGAVVKISNESIAEIAWLALNKCLSHPGSD